MPIDLVYVDAMRIIRTSVLLLCVAILGCAEDPPDTSEVADDVNLTCTTYLTDPTGVHVPACVSIPSGTMPSAGWPLDVALHLTGGTGVAALSRVGLSTLATVHIIIAPDGLKNGGTSYFDTGTECCDAAVHDPTHTRDLDWLVDLVHQEIATGTVDTARIGAVGLSNGGFGAASLVCYDPTDFAYGVGASGSPTPSWCTGAPIVLRMSRGTADGTVFYDDLDPSCPGGTPCRLGGNNNYTHYYSATDATPYGCTGFSATGAVKDYDASVTGSESTEYLATGCGSGTEIDLISMAGSLHSPGWKTLWYTDTKAWMDAHHR